jgi:inward rectifier potassium channel
MQKGQQSGLGMGHDPDAARVRLGSYEFKKKGVSRFDMRDPYHLAVALTWPHFLATLLAIYVLVNVVFATLFWLIPSSVANARPHDFGDAFFFSIETLSTVGYGDMYPKTLYGHAIAAIEIVCGLAFTAILTGLTFVRFSRPRAKLVFAANPCFWTRQRSSTCSFAPPLRTANVFVGHRSCASSGRIYRPFP